MEPYLDLTHIGTGDDWTIDRVLLDEQIQRIDLYLFHSGSALICPEAGGCSMIIERSGHGGSRFAMNSSVLCIVRFPGFSHLRE